MTAADIANEIEDAMQRRTAAGGYGTFTKTVTGLNCRLSDLIRAAREVLSACGDGRAKTEMNVYELCKTLRAQP